MNKHVINLFASFIKDRTKRDNVVNILNGNSILKNVSLNDNDSYEITGLNNRIIVIEAGVERELFPDEQIFGLSIRINGNNNLVKIELPLNAKSSRIDIVSNNAVVEIGSSSMFNNVNIRCRFGANQFVKIGKGTTICGLSIYCDEDSSCIIGEDCMFSFGINVFPSDGHSIIDNETNKVLNKPSRSLKIGNHVWVGHGAKLTKNAIIHDNSVVGGDAVAVKDYGEGDVVIAGNPAKVIKRNIRWVRENPLCLTNK